MLSVFKSCHVNLGPPGCLILGPKAMCSKLIFGNIIVVIWTHLVFYVFFNKPDYLKLAGL